MYDIIIDRINLNNEFEVEEVKKFLNKHELDFDDDIDFTLVARSNNEIKATCSKSKNILKCFAISKELRGEGITATLISKLDNRLFEEGIYHSFIFTKPDNIDIFKGVGYKFIETGNKVALLENGIYNINSYISKIKKENSLSTHKNRGAIVMNCNPFTLGHLYLIEQASINCEELLIFIVEENKSMFPFEVRYNMVNTGIKHLSNVKVIKGGEYIISAATFPTYFLRKNNEVLDAYTSLDVNIFGKYFSKELNIKKRFVGDEPYCEVTNAYNKALAEILPKYGVELCVVKRKERNFIPISASMVRQYIKNDQWEEIVKITPTVTQEFLKTDGGKEIAKKIKESNSPH